jgi:hypothetical protein
MYNELGKLISKLIITWVAWNDNNSKALDTSLSYRKRRKAAEQCERLILQRYILVGKIDNFWDECIKNGNN